jgi:hypothetical protein
MLISDIKLVSSEAECELQAKVKTNAARKSFLLWYRFPRAFKNLIDPRNGDPFVAALLLPAMKAREALEIPAPVSPRLVSSAERIQAIYRNWNPGLSEVQVRAPVRRKEELSLGAAPSPVGLFFSCGVDSFYTLLRRTGSHPGGEETITHLIVLHGFDLFYGKRNSRVFDAVLTNARKVGRELGKSVLPIATNLRDFGDRFVHFGTLYHGAALASVGLALEQTFHRIYIASTHSSARLMPWGSDPVLDPLWSTERLSFMHADSEPRVDKIRHIVQFPTVLETLRVCTIHSYADIYNCGSCEKCLRTMVALHIVGALRKCKTLPDSIDVGLLRDIHLRDRNARSFIEELVDALGSSEIDLAMKSALEESLSGGTGSRVKRILFWAMNYFAAAYMPSLFPACHRIQRAFSGRSRIAMRK